MRRQIGTLINKYNREGDIAPVINFIYRRESAAYTKGCLVGNYAYIQGAEALASEVKKLTGETFPGEIRDIRSSYFIQEVDNALERVKKGVRS